MSVKEEFEKAFEADYGMHPNKEKMLSNAFKDGARWMAERCCQEVFAQCSSDNVAQRTAVAIRKLAKELQ